MAGIDPAGVLREGVLACREERWKDGLESLTQLLQVSEGKFKLPPVVFSYLGVATAHVKKDYKEAIRLGRHSVELDPVDPDIYLNLAHIYTLSRKRRAALRVCAWGFR